MDQPQTKGPAGGGLPPRFIPPVVTPPPPPAPAAMNPPEKENIKETIESILVAFILAFVFRAFVVEAFVIPSGSMAPTLLGAHMRYRCEDCGYQFDINYPSDRSDDENISIPNKTGPRMVNVRGRLQERPITLSMHCPNCGYKVPQVRSDPYDSATNSPVHYGDRILVLKYLYEIQAPRRWDVVVFKTPWGQGRYETNFIKRLAGRPGEAIMILDGDVYVAPGEVPQEKREWEVQTKPRAAQEALWRIVYDNDFCPRSAAPERQSKPFVMPWQQNSGSGWKEPKAGEQMRVLTFDNANGSGKLSFNKDANRGNPSARAWLALTDWLPYNETRQVDLTIGADYYGPDYYPDEQIPYWYVSDVKLHFFYERKSGDGILRATLTKLDHSFTAEITPEHARLMHRSPDGTVAQVGEADLKFAGAAPLDVEFTNVDYQVTLRVSGKDVIRTTAQQYKPDVADLLRRHNKRLDDFRNPREALRQILPPPAIEIAAERQKCEISHLSLWRDVYYTPSYDGYGPKEISNAAPRDPIVLHKAGQIAPNGKPYENEYFVLGDNSILSGDARNWTTPVDLVSGEDLEVESGRVPERFLLGKAFFVYWPAGYRPLSPNMPGLIPNFGEMRFIH